MATTINAGRVRFISRGTYNNSTQYYLFDLVDYNGSSYIAKENTLGNLPTNTQYWQLIAEKGNTGNTGQTGPVGPTGNGIASITKTGTDGLVDTYTITYTNGNTTTFTITNGEDANIPRSEFDKLKNENETLKSIVAQMPQVEGQGTEVTLEDTIEAPFTKFETEGHSEQESTSISGGDEYDSPSPEHEQPIKSCGDNVNLFDKDTVVNGYLNTSGEVVSSSIFKVSDFIDIKNWIDLTISGSHGSSEVCAFYDSNKNFVSAVGLGTNTTKTITVTSNAKYFRATVHKDVINTVKIEKGSKATSYSPYGMGSITDKIVNKNLLEITENNLLVHCSYVSGANTNEYKVLCTAPDMYTNEVQATGTAYDKTRNGNLIPCKYGETIYFDTGNSLFDKNFFTEFDENFISLGSYNKQMVSGTYTPTNSNCKYVTYRFGYGANAVAGTTYTLAPIVSKTPIDSYVPHEEQTYSIYTQQPFRSIGDVRACFIKENGTWYERHNIARYFFNAQSNIIKLSATNNTTFQLTTISSLIKKPSASNIAMPTMSNFFKGIYTANEIFGQNIVGLGVNASGNVNIGIGLDKAETTAEEIKSELISKGAYIDYPLAEPLDLLCTEEQIEILENLPSTYAGQTNIYSEDEIPAYLEVSGLYDLKKLINN